MVGLTAGQTITFLGKTYKAVSELEPFSCKGCCWDRGEECGTNYIGFCHCHKNRVIFKRL